jgi:hypothetical protein
VLGGGVQYSVESVEEMKREKGKFGAATQPLLHIYCYIRNQRLGTTKDARLMYCTAQDNEFN